MENYLDDSLDVVFEYVSQNEVWRTEIFPAGEYLEQFSPESLFSSYAS